MQIYDQAWADNYERLAEAGIPGRSGLYRLCAAALSDCRFDAHVLVVGCGTGSDLISLAKAYPNWTFDGVEPSPAMREFCHEEIGRLGLSGRVALHDADLASFTPSRRYDAATSVLVSQHISDDDEAASFFKTLYELLLPDGRLFTADIHIPANQDRDQMLKLWHKQAVLAGTPSAIASALHARFASDLRPRDEVVLSGFLLRAGFHNVIKPFSSLIYGAWAASKDA